MPKEKKYDLDVPEMIPAEEFLAKYIRKIVREEVEKYFDEQIPDFEEANND